MSSSGRNAMRHSSDLWSRVSCAPASLLLATAIWLAALAWLRPLALPDEGRYTDIARWMAESGDWLIPRVNGLPFLHKPPLYFWLEAAAIKVFGQSTLVDRFVSLLSALVICLCVFCLVRRFVGTRSARWSVPALALNPLFYAGAQFANLDMLVAALITATITLTVASVQLPGSGRWLCVGAYATAGLAVLAKGLIGVVLPGMVFVAWSIFARRPDWIARAVSPIGIPIFFIIVIPWFLAVEQKFPGFLRYFLVYHHFERFLAPGFNNAQGPWFYPAVLLVGMLPWTVAPLLHWRSSFKSPASSAGLRALGIIWFAVVVVFFSLPRSKLIGYIFPALPAFAIVIGPWFASYQRRGTTAAIGAVVCVCAAIIAALVFRTGPIGVAADFNWQIAPTDKVVFVGGYLFDVAIVLNRRTPIYITGDWSRRSSELPDSVRRQFTEGREFEPASGDVLIGTEALKSLVSEPNSVWIWVRKAAVASIPNLAGLAIVGSEGEFVLLHGLRRNANGQG